MAAAFTQATAGAGPVTTLLQDVTKYGAMAGDPDGVQLATPVGPVVTVLQTVAV